MRADDNPVCRGCGYDRFYRASGTVLGVRCRRCNQQVMANPRALAAITRETVDFIKQFRCKLAWSHD